VNKVAEAEIKTVKCSLCGNVDEGIEFTVPIFWGLFKVKVGICEGCVSRLFRKFRKSK